MFDGMWVLGLCGEEVVVMGRAETIAALRSGIAALSGEPQGFGGADFDAGALPVPGALEAVLGGVVRRGFVIVFDHLGAVLAALVAEVSKEGRVALVGVPEMGLVSVVEQGGDLSRVLCVPDPGAQPLEVLGLMAEGVDLVVAALPAPPSPSLARPLQARLRKFDAALVFVGQDWPGAVARVASRVEGVEGLGAGFGRISAVTYSVEASGTRFPRRSCRWRVGEAGVVDFPAISLARHG
nr:hypothetical protein [Corynebacterium lactis]